MATEKPESKGKGGGKLTRSEVVTVRMDSQLHYLAELAARKHRRTLSSFIEWAVQQSFKTVELYHGNGYNNDESVFLNEVEGRLWDVDPSERFARLGHSCTLTC
jgi:DNA-nicking Smr family endonuclease